MITGKRKNVGPRFPVKGAHRKLIAPPSECIIYYAVNFQLTLKVAAQYRALSHFVYM